MADREKVIREIQYCTKDCADPGEDECNPGKCRYAVYQNSYDYDCKEMLLKDALALLREQEPRVLEYSEIKGCPLVWLEDNDKDDVIPALFLQYNGWSAEFSRQAPDKYVDTIVRSAIVIADERTYGITWRAWTSRPTEKQRKAVKWE